MKSERREPLLICTPCGFSEVPKPRKVEPYPPFGFLELLVELQDKALKHYWGSSADLHVCRGCRPKQMKSVQETFRPDYDERVHDRTNSRKEADDFKARKYDPFFANHTAILEVKSLHEQAVQMFLKAYSGQITLIRLPGSQAGSHEGCQIAIQEDIVRYELAQRTTMIDFGRRNQSSL